MGIIAYKLFRQLKSGEITSLYCNKTRRLSYNVWMEAENHKINGLAERPGWHCLIQPVAPHLKKVGRIWKLVEIENVQKFERPANQGGIWYLAQRMMILNDIVSVTLKEMQEAKFYAPHIPLKIIDI